MLGCTSMTTSVFIPEIKSSVGSSGPTIRAGAVAVTRGEKSGSELLSREALRQLEELIREYNEVEKARAAR